MNLFLELWKNHILAEKRNPIYEKNKFAKIFIYINIAFWIGYLILLSTLLGIGLQDEAVEPYHIINSGLIYLLLIDIIVRIIFQKTPTQEIKPYLLLPLPRKKLIDFLLLRSGLNKFNLIWLSFFLPFAIITVTRFYGITGIITYCLGIWMLILFNNYWYLFCRTLVEESIWWLALPLIIYSGLLLVIFLPYNNLLEDFFLNMGEGFITGQLSSFLGTVAAIAFMFYLNRRLLHKLVYVELNKVEDSTVKVWKLSNYNFLNHFGEVGEYMRLELKMLLRNKICRRQTYLIFIVNIMFSLIFTFTDTYTGGMKDFFIFYNFVLVGLNFISPIMRYEGNYIDGLMSRKESIYNLLRAKYIIYALAQLIPFVIMIPGMITSSISPLLCLSCVIYMIGPVYCIIFQLAIYNSNTIPLNAKIMSRQNTGTSIQNLITGSCFFIPFAFYSLVNLLAGETYTPWILIAIGIVFIATSQLWLKNIYHRFMKRRYKNLQEFRDSREKL